MPDDRIEQELREQYPAPSAAATERARAAVADASPEPSTRLNRWRLISAGLAAAVVAVGAIAAWEAFHASAATAPAALHFSKATTRTTYPRCAARTGTGAYDTTLSSSSGRPGSTVTVSGPLPVVNEAGVDVGQTASEVIVYWNLDFKDWGSALTAPLSPSASVAGTPVQLLGTQDVANLCSYHVQVKIPSAPTGTYPIVVLYEGSDTTGVSVASFLPVSYRVTGG